MTLTLLVLTYLQKCSNLLKLKTKILLSTIVVSLILRLLKNLILSCVHILFLITKDQEKAIKKFNNLLNDNGYLLLAQASINNFYDKISMFAVKFYTGFGKYPSIKKIESLTKEHFNLIKVIKIKEKFFMPSICLFLLTKKGETNND